MAISALLSTESSPLLSSHSWLPAQFLSNAVTIPKARLSIRNGNESLCHSGGWGAEGQDAGFLVCSLQTQDRDPLTWAVMPGIFFNSFGELFRPSAKGSGSLADNMARLFGSGSPVLCTRFLVQAPVSPVSFIHPFILSS